MSDTLKKPTVGFFVTCLVDIMRPRVGFAAVKLLEQAGCEVEVPRSQSCCGQPAYNNGDEANSLAIAKQIIKAFDQFDYIVVPSGSCAGMFSEHFPRLFRYDLDWLHRAQRMAAKTWELTRFLVEVMRVDSLDSCYPAKCAYHDSCSGLRELGIRSSHGSYCLWSRVCHWQNLTTEMSVVDLAELSVSSTRKSLLGWCQTRLLI